MSTIEARLAELQRDAAQEGETINEESLADCRVWLTENEPRPRITLTPAGTLHVHWLLRDGYSWSRSAEFLGGGNVRWTHGSGDDAEGGNDVRDHL